MVSCQGLFVSLYLEDMAHEDLHAINRCDKIRYTNKDEAMERVRYLIRQGIDKKRGRPHWYRCDQCGYLHIGRRGNGRFKQIRGL